MSYPIRRVVAALVFMVALTASAQVQKIDDLSFAVPEGWKYESNPAAGNADMVWTNANGAYCIIVLAKPVPSRGNIETDFCRDLALRGGT